MRNTLVSVLLISCLISIASAFAFDNTSEKVLIIFSADWCKYCHIAKNDIKNDPQLSEIVKNYTIVDIDFDVDKEIVKGYNIKSIPTFVVFENGKEKDRLQGYKGPNSLLLLLKLE
jgi:thiol-disulfide isomerase/thioredoxin